MKVLPKRTIAVAGLCALALSSTLFASCSSSSADQEILDRLDQMETEIAELKGSSAANNGQTPESSASSQDASSESSLADTAASDIEATIADLEARAATAIETADAVAVPQASADRLQAYLDAKEPLEALDREADELEDQLETQYRQGAIEREAFWGYDQRANAVEDSLDDAADRLELRMGVDG